MSVLLALGVFHDLSLCFFFWFWAGIANCWDMPCTFCLFYHLFMFLLLLYKCKYNELIERWVEIIFVCYCFFHLDYSLCIYIYIYICIYIYIYVYNIYKYMICICICICIYLRMWVERFFKCCVCIVRNSSIDMSQYIQYIRWKYLSWQSWSSD